MRTRTLLISVVVILVVIAGVYFSRGSIAVAMLDRGLARNMTADAIAELPDGLHVGLCGSGAPMAAGDRGGPCTAVIAGQRLFVVDAGSGAARKLTLMGFPVGRVERILITHFHSDHIDGLGELMMQRWVNGPNSTPVPVHGPEGVASVVDGFNAAYSLDKSYRIAHHGVTVAPPSGSGGSATSFALGAGETILLDSGGLKITAFPVDHSPIEPAVGYKFSYKGRTAVISGDTKPAAGLEAAAKDADLLVHEALSPKLVGMNESAAVAAGKPHIAKIMHDIVDYHTSPEQAAQIAARAHVRTLLLTHIIPPLPLDGLEGPFLGDAKKIYDGPLYLGHDGDLVSLPVGSTKVVFANRL